MPFNLAWLPCQGHAYKEALSPCSCFTNTAACPAGAAGDGTINEEDLTLILRQLAGSGLSDSEVANLVRRVFAAAGASTERGITFAEYRNALSGTHVELRVDVPAED